MGKENIYLTQHVIKDCDFEVIQLARKLAEIDDDFNGKNGDEYLWDISKEGGFSSNLEYAISEISKEHDGIIQIKQFVDIWTSNNSQYTAESGAEQ